MSQRVSRRCSAIPWCGSGSPGRRASNDFPDTTAARLTFLAFLHDFGKLNVGFQFKVRRQNELPRRGPRPAGHIAEALLCFESV